MKMKVEIEQSGTHQYLKSFPFLQNYKDTLQVQVLESAGKLFRSTKFGTDLSEEKLGHFQEEQIGQLYELMLESTKTNRQFDIQEDNKWNGAAVKCSWGERKKETESALMNSDH